MTDIDQNTTTISGPAEFLSERELGARWKKSPRTLQRWRRRGCSPPFLRIGASVLYRLVDVVAYETSNRSEGALQ